MYGCTTATFAARCRCWPIMSAISGNEAKTSTISATMNSGLRLRRPVAPSKKIRWAYAPAPRLNNTSTNDTAPAPA
ncbi:hypothetical protein D3C83_194680 [compost metagenome]